MRGGAVSSDGNQERYDLDRLERAVDLLVRSHRALETENAALRSQVNDQQRRIRALDGQMLTANQRRQDALKRLDELIAQMDQLDAQLAEQQD